MNTPTKEHPILFNADMVRAILDGRKTMTRRVVKKQPHGSGSWVQRGLDWVFPNICPSTAIKCPYGKVGDRLWVRETFSSLGNYDGLPVDANGELCDLEFGQRIYKASSIQKPNNYGLWTSPEGIDFDGRWTPSIHMPRWASRITLEITAIRIERLKDISEEDSVAEGVEFNFDNDDAFKEKPLYKFYPCNDLRDDTYLDRATTSFYSLWIMINGRNSWSKNPMVWVVEFKVI